MSQVINRRAKNRVADQMEECPLCSAQMPVTMLQQHVDDELSALDWAGEQRTGSKDCTSIGQRAQQGVPVQRLHAATQVQSHAAASGQQQSMRKTQGGSVSEPASRMLAHILPVHARSSGKAARTTPAISSAAACSGSLHGGPAEKAMTRFIGQDTSMHPKQRGHSRASRKAAPPHKVRPTRQAS